jgi:hypothetical protein
MSLQQVQTSETMPCAALALPRAGGRHRHAAPRSAPPVQSTTIASVGEARERPLLPNYRTVLCRPTDACGADGQGAKRRYGDAQYRGSPETLLPAVPYDSLSKSIDSYRRSQPPRNPSVCVKPYMARSLYFHGKFGLVLIGMAGVEKWLVRSA